MKKYLIIVLVALGSLVLGSNGFAQESKGSARGAMGSQSAEGRRMNAFSAIFVACNASLDAKPGPALDGA